jgi:glycosyltransferase involved in cell wall biosynthesis
VKVVQITRTIAGGAGMAARRQHAALRTIGVDSTILVTGKRDKGDGVHVFRQDSPLPRFRRNIEKWRRELEYRPYRSTASPKLELFSDDRMDGKDLISGNLPKADVYNLHWINRAIDIGGFTSALSRYQPLAWTLHDMNPFTGGCHYSGGCEKFTAECGSCPLLGSCDAEDISARSFRRKWTALQRLSEETTCIIAPSRWMQSLARRSALLKRFEVVLIPNGIDCDVFHPRSSVHVHEELGLPAQGAIVLFAADSGANYRKGFDLFQAAAGRLATAIPITLVSVGYDIPDFNCRHTHLNLGRIDTSEKMSKVFAAADVFVTPVREENLATVVLESMACGTPVVSFDVGGMPDMVRHGETGLLAQKGDVRALREAIETVLSKDQLRHSMGREGRRVAVNEYTLDRQARCLLELYDRLARTSNELTRASVL